MAARVAPTLVVARSPVAYSFCASSIRSVLLVGVAVEGGRPIRLRKEGGGIVGGWGGWIRMYEGG